ncbi:hypothetical protein ACIA5G_52145 [Amycolatopsis sp. NPDC051758]|uniref:hypothetical protein n=1 Tax=Amycolatopsis sp. NPDC051758 TaxID=3363935 RepID=UPI0037BABD7D
MIIRIESDTTAGLASAKVSLDELIGGWGYRVHETSLSTSHSGDSSRENEKSVDPVAVAALIVSIPSAALAVTDLADRIRKRRRAQDLIDKIRQDLDENTTLTLITYDGPRDLSELSSDQLLDLPRPEDPPA